MLIALLGLILLYGIIAVSRIPIDLGRTRPASATWFRPPTFNFNHVYTDGEVLGFQIGASRSAAHKVLLEKYGADHYFLNANCGLGNSDGGASAETFVPITDELRVKTLLERDVACLGSWELPIVVIISLEPGTVRAVEVTYLRLRYP
jgi:hypothetical protein